MMDYNRPPVPPRPTSSYTNSSSGPAPPPPVPPLPPNFNGQDPQISLPHFEDPLVAPRPHKITPDLPADMARTLDHQLSQPPQSSQRLSVVDQPYAAFRVPSRASVLPPPQGSDWSPWNIPNSQPTPSPRPTSYHPPPPPSSALPMNYADAAPPGAAPPPRGSSFADTTPNAAAAPSLTAPLPTLSALTAALPAIQNPNGDQASKVAWCRDVLLLVDRSQAQINSSEAEPPAPGPADIQDPQLNRLAHIAVPLVVQLSNPPNPAPSPLPPHVAEAIYHRANLAASGAFPMFVQLNPRSAFRDYEKAARAGYHAGWFKLGRDYENFGDLAHAKDCFERGVKYANESCLYRLGMANLMGQLGFAPNPDVALPLLQRAANLATIEVPQPAYVYGLLLLSEFSHVTIPPHHFTPFIPLGQTLDLEARRHLERAAFLNFAPAQYKLGHAYEFAQPPFPFDALLSVQYYSLASQQGETEADMALSKWFLCGAEGSFEKDEGLAFTFAEKAARKGLPSAEFAMGYYMEVGVGGTKDVEAAIKWYQRASQHGNTDATERLTALSQPAPQALSRTEHDTLTETTLVRKRTQAKQRSDARGPRQGQGPENETPAQQIISSVRKNSIAHRERQQQQQQQQQNGGQVGSPKYANNALPASPRMNPANKPPMQRIASGPGPDAFPQPQAQAQAQPMQPQHAASLPPAGPAQQRAHPNAPRYGLSDPGPASSPAPSRGNSIPQPGEGGEEGGAGGGQGQRRQPVQKGPATFEEMGFKSQKLEEKECVIM